MRVPVLAAVLTVVLAPAADAAVRYAAPAGEAGAACTRAAPCSAAGALAASEEGDTVLLGPGTYAEQPLVVERAVTVTARRDGPRPVILVTGTGAVALTVGPAAGGAVVEHVALRAGGAAAGAIALQAGADLEDLDVRTRTAPCLDTRARGVRLEHVAFSRTHGSQAPCLRTTGRDTAWNGVSVRAPASDVAAVYEGNGEVAEGTFGALGIGLALAGRPVVHRVTGRGARAGILLAGEATLTDSVGVAHSGGTAVLAAEGTHTLLNVTAWSEGPGSRGVHAAGTSTLHVRNTIARGRAIDLAADAPGAALLVTHSNFRTHVGAGDGGANQSAAPRFVDARFGDFRLRRGSPAVDAGAFEANAGGADRAGRFRWLGRAPDIGAYEFAPPRPARPLRDRVAPRLARVMLTATRFRAGRRGTAFSAAARSTGSVLRFVVSEPAEIVLTVARARPRSPVLGAIVVAAERGAGRTKLSGEVDGRLLAPGRYVLTATARDTTQNLSRPVRLGFRVVR